MSRTRVYSSPGWTAVLSIAFLAACGRADAVPADRSGRRVIEGAPSVVGRIVDATGAPLPGVFVTFRPANATYSHTRITDGQGRFVFDRLPPGDYDASAHRPGLTTWTGVVTVTTAATASADIELAARAMTPADASSAAFLALLPDGEEKRRFMLDCTGCHVLDERIALPGGVPRTEAAWAEAVTRMLGFAGPRSGFPVIAHGREPAATAAYLAAHLGGRTSTVPALTMPAAPDPATVNALVTEYDIPEPGDLPHDLAIDSAGRILITGMFTHRMYLLDPTTGVFDVVPIPVADANPRAVELTPDGAWWVLLGGPQRAARYDPATAKWTSYPIGVYGHSIGIDGQGRAWFNGHFTRDPILLGFVDPATSAVETFHAPAHPMVAAGGNPIPYELRIAPDGTVWTSELTGNRVVSFDPERRAFAEHMMPTSNSGPRRLDVGPDGAVWIPEYANNALGRLNPAAGAMREWSLPVEDAAPYVARVDPRSGVVWLGTGAADALLSFDPRSERFMVYRLPTRGALVRHIAIDPRNGDVWAAYGASPGVPSKVARLRPGEPAR